MDEFDENVDETFQEPKKRFWQRSSRKRTKSDVISVSSMDISLDSSIMKRKRRRRITELASNFLSSSTTGRLSNALQRSFGIQVNNTSISMINEEDVDSGPSKRTRSKCEPVGSLTIHSWLTDVAGCCVESLSPSISRTEIKRQEAIYELYCGENILLNDLQILRENYFEPLQSNDIFTASELRTLFGDLDMLVHVHTKLRDDLIELRDSSGFTNAIGPIMLEWLPTLTEPYVDRCKSQILAKHILEVKKSRSKKFQEFLKKRMEVPHAVDLWTYLDVTRSRIVKYPLLVNEILRRTSSSHEDYVLLKEASILLSNLLEKIDRSMGEAECDLARSKILVKTEYDPDGCIKAAQELITEGQLKDSRGLKLYCFLFDTCLVLTRRVIKSREKKFNVTYPVISKDQMQVDAKNNDVNDYELKIADFILFVRDEHDKRHWIDALKKATSINNITKNNKSIDNDDKSSDELRILREKQFLTRNTRERPI